MARRERGDGTIAMIMSNSHKDILRSGIRTGIQIGVENVTLDAGNEIQR